MASRDPDDFRSELEEAQERAARAERELEAAKREVEDLRADLTAAEFAPMPGPSLAPWLLLGFAALVGGASAQVASARRQARLEQAAASAVVAPEESRDHGPRTAKSPLRFEESRRFPDAIGVVAGSGGVIGKRGVVYLPPGQLVPLTTLVEMSTPLKDVLAATLVASELDRFHVAVGSRGAAAVRRDGTWTVERTGLDSALLAVAAADDGRVFAVGEHGTIVRRDPTLGWLSDSSHVTETLRAVAVAAPKSVVAAGDDGVVLVRGEGGDWVRRRTPTSATLRVVLPTADGAFIIAGDRGTLLLFEDDSFEVLHPPVTDDFVGAASYLTRLVLATRHGKVVTYESMVREWSVADVAPGEEIVGLSTTFLDVVLVARSGRTFVGRLSSP